MHTQGVDQEAKTGNELLYSNSFVCRGPLLLLNSCLVETGLEGSTRYDEFVVALFM